MLLNYKQLFIRGYITNRRLFNIAISKISTEPILMIVTSANDWNYIIEIPG